MSHLRSFLPTLLSFALGALACNSSSSGRDGQGPGGGKTDDTVDAGDQPGGDAGEKPTADAGDLPGADAGRPTICSSAADCGGTGVCCTTGEGSFCAADHDACLGLVLCAEPSECEGGEVCCPQGFCGGCD